MGRRARKNGAVDNQYTESDEAVFHEVIKDGPTTQIVLSATIVS